MSDKIPGSSYDNPIVYRGHWLIYLSDARPKGGFEYVHADYDGPEDNRCGWALTVEACKLEIDGMDEGNN